MPFPYTDEDKRRGQEIFKGENLKNVVWPMGAHNATGMKETISHLSEEDQVRYYEKAQRERLAKDPK